VAGWLVPSDGKKIPEQPGWYLPPQKIPLAENRFLQAGKGAENTKEKSRQCFEGMRRAHAKQYPRAGAELPALGTSQKQSVGICEEDSKSSDGGRL
jgi:hypothetical protein